MKNWEIGRILVVIIVVWLIGLSLTVTAQGRPPRPAPSLRHSPMPPNGIGWNPGIGLWNVPSSAPLNNMAPWAPGQNEGFTNVIACGYDAQGVWRVLPLYVKYKYNGVQYDVTVKNAWNPWTSTWDTDVDVPAYNTDYYINGKEYNFYCVTATGTYYFNL